MRASTPPVCTHCRATKSPLWRRGAQQEVLCNACGLYWKHHGCYRPLSLQAAADRKQETSATTSSNDSPDRSAAMKSLTFHDFMKVAKQNGSQSATKASSAHYTSSNTAGSGQKLPSSTLKAQQSSSSPRHPNHDPRKPVGGPLKTANILMAPGQYGYSGSGSSTNLNHANGLAPAAANVLLPPLKSVIRPVDRSSPLAMANARQLTAAAVLPNLKSVIDLQQQQQQLQQHHQHQHQQQQQQQQQQQTAANLRAPGSLVIGSGSDVPGVVSVAVPPSVAKASTSLPIKFIINKGVTLYQGDHVAVLGDDSQVYFAVLVDFWLTENGRRYCTLRWLLPKSSTAAYENVISSTSVVPSLDNFTLGPVHTKVESMEAILDVFYSPYRDKMSSEMIRKRFLSTFEQQNSDESVAKLLLSMS